MNQTAQQINEIKNLMERSSRFLSLSGLSGIAAGTSALIGAAIAFFNLNYTTRYLSRDLYFIEGYSSKMRESIQFLVIVALAVLSVALLSAAFFTIRKTRHSNEKIWSQTTRRLLVQLFIPLAAGGIFCALLIYHHMIFLIAPCTLLFYGMALLNASKYTLREIQWLGISEIILGLLATFWLGYGLIFWAMGFGVLHIIYGIAMYIKYDRK